MSNGLPFKNVSSRIINHPIEKRGFVSAPLDYADPKSKKLMLYIGLNYRNGANANWNPLPCFIKKHAFEISEIYLDENCIEYWL